MPSLIYGDTSVTFSSKASQGLDTTPLQKTRLSEPLTLVFDDSFNELDGIVRIVEGRVGACTPWKLDGSVVFDTQNQVLDALTSNIEQQLTPTTVVWPNDFDASDAPPLSLWFSVYEMDIGLYSAQGFSEILVTSSVDAELAIRVTLRMNGRILAQIFPQLVSCLKCPQWHWVARSR